MNLKEFLRLPDTPTAAEMASRLGVSRQTIYHYIQGERIPSAQMVKRIAIATGGLVGLDDLLPQEEKDG